MNPYRKSRLALGLVLILLGALFLLFRFYPNLQEMIHLEWSWPLIIIGVGVVILLIGLLTAVPGMAVPACVIAGIGGILYYQNVTQDWASWAYAWALIPGFSGVGQVITGILGKHERKMIGAGLWQIFISAILFLVFGSFLGPLGWLGPFWPLLLIVAGLALIVRVLVRRRD
jgi:hypothetical protein